MASMGTSEQEHAGAGIPVLPEVAMNLVRPADPVIATIAGSRLCMRGRSASFVRHVEIDIGGTPLEGRFLPGQSFGIVPPGQDDRGKPHPVRLYSIASPTAGEDGEGRIIATTPKRLIAERSPQKPDDDPDAHDLILGICSNWLCDRRPGDPVRVTGPSGRSFLLPIDREAHDYVFIATGTGIAPFRGMMMDLFPAGHQPTQSQVHLLMGAPYETDLLYDDQLRGWDEAHENFHYHIALSRQPSTHTGRPMYVDALLAHLIERGLRDLLASPRTLIYICGLKGMQAGVFRVLAIAGLQDAYLRIRDDETASMSPDQWDAARIGRSIRSTPRCMIEVY